MSSLFNIAAGGQAAGFYDYQIEQSLRFNESSQAYLRKTNFSGSPTSDQTGTFSVWVKNTLSYSNNRNAIYGSATGSAAFTSLSLSGSSQVLDLRKRNGAGSDTIDVIGNPAQRDPSSWYHIMSVYDMTNSTRNDRAQIYVNGVRVTDLGTNTLPSNTATTYYSGDFLTDMQIGRTNTNSSNMLYADFILAEYHRVDGQALDPTDFGEFKSGVWVPKQYTGAYGNHGFYLDFADTSDIGKDVSGNGNDFTANNLSAHAVVPDSPTLNYATLNSLALGADGTLNQGNLKINYGTATTREATTATMGVSSGKWYWEVRSQTNGGEIIGITTNSDHTGRYPGNTTGGYGYYADDGNKYIEGTSSAYGDSYTTGDIISFALDMDAGTLVAYKNGVSQGTLVSSLTGDIYPAIGDGGSAGTTNNIFNFGQDSTFAGSTTSGGNSDENGYGDFKYSVPSGFLALNSANLPEPSITPLNDDLPEDYFNTAIWTGNGTSQTISGVSHQPDFMWIKRRSTSRDHQLVDTVRGLNVGLQSNLTNGESTDAQRITSVNSDGYVVGSSNGTNTNNETYVGWSWLAGGTAVSNTDGSITSSVSANTKAGFSIVTYIGSGTNSTIGHGLGATPSMIIVKRRTTGTSQGWQVFHPSIPNMANGYIYLHATNAFNGTYSAVWGGGNPTSTVFSVGTDGDTNFTGGIGYVAYCFAEIEGYSKFGSYSGNGANDGTFVYTGFRPAFVGTKIYSGGSGGWIIQDTTRSVNNQMTDYLLANTDGAEQTGVNIDLLSNGFKWRAASTSSTINHNASGDDYIYMAFAEMPTKYANAR